MDSFVFHNPTKFVFGPGAEEKIGLELNAMSIQRVLLVYGQGSVVKSGLLERVKAALTQADIQHWELGGVLPNPLSGPVYEGIQTARARQVQLVVGLGGGSAIDTAKAIALGVPYEGDFWDFFSGKAAPKARLPVATVLTIAAAGSEASNSAVITHEGLQLKRGVKVELNRPVLSLMNPELTYSVPSDQKANGTADMMAHIFERYFTNSRDVGLSDELCEGVLRNIIQAGPKALADPRDYAAHADLMWAGTLAHNDTLSPGRQQDWATHAISYAISTHYGAAHGSVLSVLFPKWMRHVLKQDPARCARFAVKVMGVEPVAGDDAATAEKGIQALEAYYLSLGLPANLRAYGVKEADVKRLAAEAPYRADGAVGFFVPLKVQDVEAIYLAAL